MSEFHFLRPQLFLLLIPAIALLVWLWRGHHHSNVWQKVCDAPLLNYLLINKGAKQTKLPLILIGVCALLAITALAGPTYEQQQQPIFRQQTALVVVLDLSTSMLATDVSPSRLTQAKHKVLDILQRRKEGLTALVVFAGSAYTVTPLTEDTETISAMVNSLTPVMMPSQGSRPDLGLEKALELLRQGNAQQAHILIVTDGFSPKGQSQWQQTPALPYTVSMIGVGTAEGTPISKPGGGFIIDKTGKIIIPKLNAEQISELARQFSGNYYPLTLTDKDIEYTLDPFVQTKLNSELAVSDLTAEQWKEIGPILLIPILLISVLGFRRGILSYAVVLLPSIFYSPTTDAAWKDWWQTEDQQAYKSFKEEKYDTSAHQFNSPEWKSSSYYQSGDYQKALDSLASSESQDANYYRGNALTKLGKHEEAISAYQQAYENNPNNLDAKENLDRLQKWVNEQKKQNQKDNDQNKDGNQDEEQNKQEKNSDNSEQKEVQNAQDDQQKNNENQDSSESQEPKDQQNSDTPPSESKAEKEAQEEAVRQHAQEQQNAEKPEDGEQAQAKPEPEKNDDTPPTEQQQAIEQWLRQVPDDPGGLLRRKFRYQYQQQKHSSETQQW